MSDVDVAECGAQGRVRIGACAHGAIKHGNEKEETATVEAVTFGAVASETGLASALTGSFGHVIVELGQRGEEGVCFRPLGKVRMHGLSLVCLPTASGQRDHGLCPVNQAAQQLEILLQTGVRKMRLMGNPRRMPSMAGYGLEITGYLSKDSLKD